MFNDLLRNDGIRRGPFGSSLKKDIFVPDTKDSYAVYEQRNAINNSFKTRYFIDQSKYDELHNFHLHTNDIIMSGAGTIGKLAKVPTGFRKGVFNQALIRFRINDKVNVNYFLTFMNTPKMQRKLTEANPGSAMVNLVPMKELKKWQILIPQLEEQNKIEKLLTQVNKLLDLYQRKLYLLKQLKQGMLQKLFPDTESKQPELRFKGFNIDWTYERLDKIGVLRDKARIPVRQNNRISGSIPYYGANGIQDYVKGYTHDGSYILIAEDGANSIENYPIYVVNGKIWVNNHAHVIEALDQIDLEFLSLSLKKVKYSKYLFGSGRYKLNADILKTISVQLTDIKEQQQIGKIFYKLDAMIKENDQKVKKLTFLKKFLLQQMFI